jgi:outer membrane receptor protein involved in Fe transport
MILQYRSAAIDSIEILKDGASTTYGADAIAGVC